MLKLNQGLLDAKWIFIFVPIFDMVNSNSSNKPVEKFSLRGITASVFENVADKGGSFYKVNIVRTYKEGNDFKTTSVFSRDDLPVVETLSKKAWIYVLQRESAQNK